MWSISAVEYYSAMKKGRSPDTPSWGMNLDDILLNERSLTL